MRYFDLSTLSMTPTSGIAESKIGLWWADGTSFEISVNSSTPGNWFLADASGGVNTASILFNLSSTWSKVLNFAFEATFNISNGETGYLELWDVTSNSAIGASQISTTSSSFTVIRSGKFTLTPGHSYGITGWSNGSYGAYISDASLIVFPS